MKSFTRHSRPAAEENLSVDFLSECPLVTAAQKHATLSMPLPAPAVCSRKLHIAGRAWPARLSLLCLIMPALSVLTGCGGGLPASVSGRVTLDGVALTTGLVTFVPTKVGPLAYGPIDYHGQYAVQTGSQRGLEPGDYVVTVAANAPPTDAAHTASGPHNTEPMLPLITPLNYASSDRTPLKASVQPGSQTLDFDLRSQ